MALKLLIDAVHADETRVVIADNGRIHDFDFVTSYKKQVKGNIYLAKITRVEPSLQAAFVEYGSGKQGFLPFSEIHPDYYQIPVADRKRLLEEAEAMAEADDDFIPSSDAEEKNFSEHSADNNGHPSEISNDTAFNAENSHSTDHSVTQLESVLPASLPAMHEVSVTHSAAIEPHDYSHADEHRSTELSEASSPHADATIHSEHQHDTLAPAHEHDHTEHHHVHNADNQEHSQPAEHSHHASDRSDASDHVEPHHEIETLATDDDAVRQARPASFHRRYKIQEVIKRGQIVLVQVIKEERGNKGVSLTTFISLAGRYCVLMPNSPKGGGISRKIMSGDDRKRLKEISAELKTARGMSAIIRTAGIDRTRAEIKRDYEYLVKLWDTIREQTLSSTAPALIYEESDIIKRTIRDLYSNDIEEIIVEGEEGFHHAKNFLAALLPSHAPRVKLHKDPVPLFYQYNIEDQLTSMYDPIVKLRSGGYIVLSPTEALISIDVNSGRSTGERNIEETATKTNLEAVAEIARQLRLRDLAGLIVIDLIDMMDSRNRRNVERALKDALRHDRAKIQIGRISPFGLMEMSRQRLRPSISESSTMPCPHCLGRGVIRSDASVAIQIIRAMEKEAASGLLGELKLFVTSDVALQLLNIRRDKLSALEQKYDLRITVLMDETLARSNFRMEKVKSSNMRRVPVAESASVDTHKILSEIPAVIEDFVEGEEAPHGEITVLGEEPRANTHDDRPRRRGRRGGRGRNNRPDNRQDREFSSTSGTSDMETAAIGEEGITTERTNDRGERPERGERAERQGGRRRPRRWKERPERTHDGQANSDASAQEFSAPREYAQRTPSDTPHRAPEVSEQPRRQSFAPSSGQPANSNVALPPLDQQVPSDIKPKKGWWRRIVES